MKVYELIALLNEQDKDAEVFIINDATGDRGDVIDVDEDGDVLLYVDLEA